MASPRTVNTVIVSDFAAGRFQINSLLIDDVWELGAMAGLVVELEQNCGRDTPLKSIFDSEPSTRGCQAAANLLDVWKFATL